VKSATRRVVVCAGGGSDRSADECDETGTPAHVVRQTERVRDRLQVRQPDTLHIPATPPASRLQRPPRPTGRRRVSIYWAHSMGP